MRIKNITYADTNETRTDGKYPIYIGSEAYFIIKDPAIGEAMYLEYISNNEDNPKEGVLITSIVRNTTETDTEIIVKTRNSIYYFEK